MQPLLVLANPRPKKAKKAKSKRRPMSAAKRKAFAARMKAARAAKSGTGSTITARRNPRGKAKAAPRRSAATGGKGAVTVNISAKQNPMAKKRKSQGARKRVKSFPISAKRNPRPVRRNPREGSIVQSTVEPAVWGAIGALGASVVWGMLKPYVPASLQSGIMGQVAAAGVALGLGVAGEDAFPQAEQMTIGALTVIGFSIFSSMLTQVAPNIALGKRLQNGPYARPGRLGKRLRAPLVTGAPVLRTPLAPRVNANGPAPNAVNSLPANSPQRFAAGRMMAAAAQPRNSLNIG